MYLRKFVSSMLAVLVLLAVFLPSRLYAGELDLKAALPVDPNIVMGSLPNGLNYWIRAHKTPPGKVGIWLHVGSGSINEENNQLGLAHFLEHMAFNGSENFPAGTLVKYFESIGLRFGQHQNAFTSFDQTTYILSLPDTKGETTGKGLQCLADFAYRMKLAIPEIDKERGVILEEARSRKGPQQRLIEKLLPLIAPGSRFAERLPIGKEDVIKVVTQDLFRSYYDTWYRPDNSTLLIVGDIEPAGVEALIKENFAAWKKVEQPKPNADPGIQPYKAMRAAALSDPELTETEVSSVSVQPLRPVRTVGQMRERLVEELGSWIINRRFAELVQKGTAPYQTASVSISSFLNVCTYGQAEASGKPERWEPMLASVVTEIKRAREHGFLAQEFEDARKETLSNAQQAARQESTQDARAFLGSMNSSLAEGKKPLSAAQRLELLQALLPGLKLEEINAAFKTNFAPEARLLLVTMPEKKELAVPSAEEILAAAKKAESAAVEALAAKERPKSLLEKDPEPGKIVQQEEEPDLKILSATFENGVRVHLRQMDFKKDQVLARIVVSGGEIRETAANRGITRAASLGLTQPATDKLSSIVIRDLMTGKNVSVGGSAAQDTMTLSIQGSPQDLEEGFRLAHLILTQAKIEDSAMQVWKQQMGQYLEMVKVSVEAQLQQRLSSLLSGDDPRFRELTPAQLEALTKGAGQGWLDGTLIGGRIEASIVGDLDRDKALALAQKYLGSLPKREGREGDLDKLRRVEVRTGPLEENLGIETITDKAVALLGWRGADWKDVKDRRILQLASQMLGARLREEIRENRSLTYSISCFSQPSQSYEGMGVFGTFFTADPAKVAEAAKLSREVMVKFVQDGPTEEEMATVRKQIKNTLETQLKEPSFWMGILADLDYRGTKLSDVKEVLEKMTSYTREEVKEVAARYCTAERSVQVIVTPKPKGDAAPPKAGTEEKKN